eukprot:CAMPEP_0197063082 /NCGR_PEP_ID=MMETSP1384-20130603/150035_1 /TAXON_ID=29189 /ORGANISM="Ammonia sp." /LENGTH=50 /DNA_ID=CAMNT_0042499233 /DNA_START=93 /DNA_END=241 /DNA_ORIENTATION=-
MSDHPISSTSSNSSDATISTSFTSQPCNSCTKVPVSASKKSSQPAGMDTA